MKAWRITLWDYPEAICYGDTRGKAAYRFWLNVSDVSDCSFAVFITSATIRRAPEHDRQVEP